MWLQLPKFGIQPSAAEIADYVALFRYLSHVIGSPADHFVDAGSAKRTMESMLVHELRTTETSRVVAYNFLQCVGNLPSPFYVSMGFMRAGSRWVNGGEMCDELDIGGAGVLDYAVFVGYCLLVTGMAWLQRLIPGLDERVIAVCLFVPFLCGRLIVLTYSLKPSSSSASAFTTGLSTGSPNLSLISSTFRKWARVPAENGTGRPVPGSIRSLIFRSCRQWLSWWIWAILKWCVLWLASWRAQWLLGEYCSWGSWRWNCIRLSLLPIHPWLDSHSIRCMGDGIAAAQITLM